MNLREIEKLQEIFSDSGKRTSSDIELGNLLDFLAFRLNVFIDVLGTTTFV